MKSLLAAGLVLATLSEGALAQSAAPPPPPAGAPAPGMKAPPPPAPGGGPAAMDDDDAGSPPPPPPGGPHGHRRPPPPSKAAHFRIEHGDTALDIKCADDEPMKACADLTLQLLDKVQAMPKP